MIRRLIERDPVSRASDRGPAGPPPINAAGLFETHADRVGRWARRLGGPVIDVEDVVQEVFVIVHRRIDRFRGDANITSWLYGITANAVLQQRRKARRRRWFGRSDEPTHESPSQPTPIEELERRRRVVAVYNVLDKMGETSRTVLVLSEMEELSGEEIAELTGMKVGTVWVRLHRARTEFSKLARKLIPDEVAAIETTSAGSSQTRRR